MPFFTYKAQDPSGKTAQGSIQAATQDEALRALLQAGMKVELIHPAGSPPPASASKPSQAQITRPQIQSAPRQTQVSRGPVQPNIQIAQPASPPQIRTAVGSDKERFFLFSQLAAAFRAGLNPVQTFQEVSQRSRGAFTPALEALAQTATEGGSIARTMAKYPDLFPNHVVGLTAAGEQGGFLPEAFQQISMQAESAHKFKRWFFWVWLVFVNAILVIPGFWWATRGMLDSWDTIDKAGGGGTQKENIGVVGGALMKQLLWPVGPTLLAFLAVFYVIYRFLGSRKTLRLRHELGLKWPVYGKRARHENLAIFTWTLGQLSKVGLAPANAYRLAAETAPNIVMRDQLAKLANQLSGAERMSDIVKGTHLFPEEFEPMIATAEYTGDLAGAFQHLSDSTRNEFQLAENYAKMRSGCWGALGCGVTSAIAMMIFFYAWYTELPARVLKGMEWLVR